MRRHARRKSSLQIAVIDESALRRRRIGRRIDSDDTQRSSAMGVVVTHQVPTDWAHPDAPFTFVTDGVGAAVRQAQTLAGSKSVAVASADIARQCLDLACWTRSRSIWSRCCWVPASHGSPASPPLSRWQMQ
jgi:hypothetical protein